MPKIKKNNVLWVDTEQVPNLLHKNSYRNVYGKNITYITDITPFVEEYGLNRPMVSDSSHVIYVKTGSVKVSVGTRDYELGPRSVLIVPPNVVSCTRAYSGDLKIHAIGFSLQHLMPLSFSQHTSVSMQLSEEAAEMLAKYGEMYRSLQKYGEGRARAPIETLVVSLLEFIDCAGQQSRYTARVPHMRSAQAIADAFLDLLNRVGATRHSVDFYAQRLGITKNYFCIVIKRETGITVGEHCKRRILQEAKNQLSITDKTAREIAYTLGFDSPAQFGNYFKHHTGQTPGEFRRELGVRNLELRS